MENLDRLKPENCEFQRECACYQECGHERSILNRIAAAVAEQIEKDAKIAENWEYVEDGMTYYCRVDGSEIAELIREQTPELVSLPPLP